MPRISNVVVTPKLAEIWHSLCQFCSTINEASKHKQRLSQDTFLEMMASVMYPCMQMLVVDGTEKALSLAMLAFCCKVFLTWPLVRVRFPWLECQLNVAIDGLMRTDHDEDDLLLLWIMVMHGLLSGSNSVQMKSRLRVKLNRAMQIHELHDWCSIKQALQSLLWIDMVFDREAEVLFKTVFDQKSVSPYSETS